MSDLAKDLLTRYYGFGAETRGLRFVSVHQSVENIKKEENKQVTEQTSLASHEETTPDEETQENVDDNRKVSTATDSYRSFKIPDNLDDGAEYDATENFTLHNIDREPNVTCDSTDNEVSSHHKESLHDIVQNTARSSIEYPETETNDAEDETKDDSNETSIQNNAVEKISDASCGTAKKLERCSRSNGRLPPVAARWQPVCNDTFADFANIGLKQFPREILSNFSHLRMMYLSNNHLTELPDEIFSILSYLEWLDVRNNHLSSLPVTIKWHSCLETILLQGNKLERLPLELYEPKAVEKILAINVAGTLANLNTIQVTQNPLVTPPEDVVMSGSAAILEYLRMEWNSAHPQERIEARKNKIEPKLSTILCYQSPRKSKKNILPVKDNHHNRLISTRERRRSYRPGNRCQNTGSNISLENRMLWFTKARELLAKQAAKVQRMKDENTLRDWRQDRRSYSKAMEKAMKRNEDDIPFGFDPEDYASTFKHKTEPGNTRPKRKDKSKYRPPTDINKRLNELLDSLNKLNINITEDATPRTKQYLFRDEIEKILQFQREIQDLQKYNNATLSLKG